MAFFYCRLSDIENTDFSDSLVTEANEKHILTKGEMLWKTKETL